MADLETLTFSVTLPGEFAGQYDLTFGDCTGRDDLDVRRETGYTILALFEQVQIDQGLSLTFACVVGWLVRRRRFPGMRFDVILDSVKWGDDFSIVLEGVDDQGKAESGPVTPESTPPSPAGTGSDLGNLTGSPSPSSTGS